MSRDELWIWLKWAEKVFLGSYHPSEIPCADFSTPQRSGASDIAGGAAPSPTQADFSTPRSGPDDFGGAAPPTFVPLWQKAISVILCIFLLFSPVQIGQVVAGETSGGYPVFDNVENASGRIRLAYGHISGTFTSEVIDAGRVVRWKRISWIEEEPTTVQEVRVQSAPEVGPAGGASAGNLGPVAEAWTNVTILGYWAHEGENAQAALAGGSGLLADAWTNLIISGYWPSENSMGEGSSENSLPKYGYLGESQPTKSQGAIAEQWTGIKIGGYWASGSSQPLENLENSPATENISQPPENFAVQLSENILLTSRVRLQVRVSRDGVEWSEWMGPDGTSESYFENSPAILPRLSGRYLQYRVYFSSDGPRLSGAAGPWISGVRVEWREGKRVGRVRAGEKGEVELGEGLLRKVAVRVKEDADVEFWAEPLAELPEGVPPIEKRVLGYAEISCSVPNRHIEQAEIMFEIPKGWLERNSVIVAYHYDGVVWEELPTSKIWENAETVSFLALST
ncbi:MAG: hypothetical protein ACK4GQ_04090, partial [Candidatus Hadarchaeales archaeon]